MYEPDEYEELERDLYKSPLREVKEQQNILLEFVLTVTILALTLNLVADVIWSIQDTVVWSVCVIVLSSLATIAIILRIVKLRFQGVSRISKEIHIVVAWDKEVKEFPKLPYLVHYSPQESLHTYCGRLDTAANNELAESMENLTIFDTRHHIPLRIFIDMILRMLYEFHDIPGRLSGMVRHGDIKGDKLEQIIIFTKEEEPVVVLPGTFDVSQHKMGNLRIQWNGPWRGNLNFYISSRSSLGQEPRSIERKLPGPTILGLSSSESIVGPDLIVLDYIVRVTASFNPFMVALNLYRCQELLNWTKKLIDHLWKMDWGFAFYRTTKDKKNKG